MQIVKEKSLENIQPLKKAAERKEILINKEQHNFL